MSTVEDDPYVILGCASDATFEELNLAYRKACSAAHPDRQGGDNSKQQKVNWAWSVLGDSITRAQWDAGQRDTVSPDKIRAEAMARLLQLYESVVVEHQAHDLYQGMVAGLRVISPEIEQKIAQCAATVKRLEKWRGAVRRKDLARSFIDEHLDKMIAGAEADVARWRIERLYHLAALELLQELENGYVQEQQPIHSLLGFYDQRLEVMRHLGFNSGDMYK